jgi:hypothetical protein
MILSETQKGKEAKLGGHLEYMFFSETLAARFQEYCAERGVDARLEIDLLPDGDRAFMVRLSEQGMQDSDVEVIEEQYSELFFGEQAALIDGNSNDGALADLCGVQVQLESGDFTTVAIEPQIMNKLLSVLSIDELQAFLSQVAEDIEHPKSGPICRRLG